MTIGVLINRFLKWQSTIFSYMMLQQNLLLINYIPFVNGVSLKSCIAGRFNILLGNKNDKFERQVRYEEKLGFAISHNCAFIEVSALLNYNIDESFTFVANLIIN